MYGPTMRYVLCKIRTTTKEGKRRRGEGEAASVFTFRQMDFIATFAAILPPSSLSSVQCRLYVIQYFIMHANPL